MVKMLVVCMLPFFWLVAMSYHVVGQDFFFFLDTGAGLFHEREKERLLVHVLPGTDKTLFLDAIFLIVMMLAACMLPCFLGFFAMCTHVGDQCVFYTRGKERHLIHE